MHQVVVFSKDSQATMLWFRTRERAEVEYQNVHEMLKGTIDATVLTVRDDFGAFLAIPLANVSHGILNDLSKQGELYKLLEGLGIAKKS